MNNTTMSGHDWLDSAENSSPEDVGSRCSSYESVAKGDENQDIVLDAPDHYNNADFNHFIELYTLRATEAGAKYWECSMADDDRALFSSTYGFGENYSPDLGTIGSDHLIKNVDGVPIRPRNMKDCNTPRKMAAPKKKKSCAKPMKRKCVKPKKKCVKPKPKKMCKKPKPKPMCPKPKAKKMCKKPKPKPVCPKPAKPKCSKVYPGRQSSAFGVPNKTPEVSIKDSHIKEN